MGIEFWANISPTEKYFVTILGSGNDHGELQRPRTYGVNLKFNFKADRRRQPLPHHRRRRNQRSRMVR